MKTIEEYREALQNIAIKDCVVEFSDFDDYVPINVLLYREVEMLNEALDELKQYRNNPPLTFDDIKISDWVWYDKPVRVDRGYYKIIDIDYDNKRYILNKPSCLGVVLDVFYKDDSFYSKEVKE